MTTKDPTFHARFRSLSQVPDHRLKAELHQMSQKSHRLDAELLLYLGELDQRRLYRDEACSSAFEFCVSRMGYSEDVAYKRVGAARLMRQFPRIYDLLAEGQLHLTALMLLKPHLTEANQENWLLAACNKSKREVEKLVASRCPKPDAKASVRRLPRASLVPMEPISHSSVVGCEDVPVGSAELTSAPATAASATAASATAASATPEPDTTFGLKLAPIAAAPAAGLAPRVTPLSGSTYRVTFTASEQLKQKLDRARELLSHCLPPSDLPALIERALDQLLEREQTRRYGASPKRKPASPRHDATAKRQSHNSLDPDPNCVVNDISTKSDVALAESAKVVGAVALAESAKGAGGVALAESAKGAGGVALAESAKVAGGVALAESAKVGVATAKAEGTAITASNRRRQPRAYVRRAVFERDAGQCTFVDRQGRRCSQRHFLEFDHIEAHALGGEETITNVRLRCAAHNRLEAERLFGRQWVASAVRQATQARSGCGEARDGVSRGP